MNPIFKLIGPYFITFLMKMYRLLVKYVAFVLLGNLTFKY